MTIRSHVYAWVYKDQTQILNASIFIYNIEHLDCAVQKVRQKIDNWRKNKGIFSYNIFKDVSKIYIPCIFYSTLQFSTFFHFHCMFVYWWYATPKKIIYKCKTILFFVLFINVKQFCFLGSWFEAHLKQCTRGGIIFQGRMVLIINLPGAAGEKLSPFTMMITTVCIR